MANRIATWILFSTLGLAVVAGILWDGAYNFRYGGVLTPLHDALGMPYPKVYMINVMMPYSVVPEKR